MSWYERHVDVMTFVWLLAMTVAILIAVLVCFEGCALVEAAEEAKGGEGCDGGSSVDVRLGCPPMIPPLAREEHAHGERGP